MNSPDFWHGAQGLCPDHRGYAATFRAWLTPIGGEYLEIPSIARQHQGIDKGLNGLQKSTGGSCKLQSVSQLISFSVEESK